MLRIVTLLLLAALCAGCAPALRPYGAPPPELPAEPTLWQLALRRGGEPLYTGLLLLSRDETGAGMVLLDATGIKLLEGRVSESGRVTEVKALGVVADRGLPDFLGQVVQQLFLNAPPMPGATCRPEGFGRLCQGLDNYGLLLRFRALGPFVLWRADYSVNHEDDPPLLTGARLGQGWLTPEVTLERRLELPE